MFYWEIVISTNKGWRYTLNKIEQIIQSKYECIDLEFSNVGETQVKKMSIGPFMSKEKAEIFANGELKKLLEKYGNDEKFDIMFSTQEI